MIAQLSVSAGGDTAGKYAVPNPAVDVHPEQVGNVELVKTGGLSDGALVMLEVG